MNFLNVLFQNSKLKQAKLYNAAKRAFDNPSIGITINNAATHVIKDCAEITLKCLPLYIFASYQNPFQELNGKFTKQEILEFTQQVKIEPMLLVLLEHILTKAKKEFPYLFETTQTYASQDILSDDPYSDYYSERTVIETKQRTIEEILFECFKCQS
jgi:hypothetical protein